MSFWLLESKITSIRINVLHRKLGRIFFDVAWKILIGFIWFKRSSQLFDLPHLMMRVWLFGWFEQKRCLTNPLKKIHFLILKGSTRFYVRHSPPINPRQPPLVFVNWQNLEVLRWISWLTRQLFKRFTNRFTAFSMDHSYTKNFQGLIVSITFLNIRCTFAFQNCQSVHYDV